MLNDLRHFHLNRWQKLEARVDDLNRVIRYWVGTPTRVGLTWGQAIVLCILAIALGLDLFRF